MLGTNPLHPIELTGDAPQIQLGSEADPVADLEPLELRVDAIEIVDLRSEGVLDPFVGVETTATLPHLDQPRPNLRDRGADVDRPRRLMAGLGDQPVARKRRGGLGRGGTPGAVPSSRQSGERRIRERHPERLKKSPAQNLTLDRDAA